MELEKITNTTDLSAEKGVLIYDDKGNPSYKFICKKDDTNYDKSKQALIKKGCQIKI